MEASVDATRGMVSSSCCCFASSGTPRRASGGTRFTPGTFGARMNAFPPTNGVVLVPNAPGTPPPGASGVTPGLRGTAPGAVTSAPPAGRRGTCRARPSGRRCARRARTLPAPRRRGCGALRGCAPARSPAVCESRECRRGWPRRDDGQARALWFARPRQSRSQLLRLSVLLAQPFLHAPRGFASQRFPFDADPLAVDARDVAQAANRAAWQTLVERVVVREERAVLRFDRLVGAPAGRVRVLLIEVQLLAAAAVATGEPEPFQHRHGRGALFLNWPHRPSRAIGS